MYVCGCLFSCMRVVMCSLHVCMCSGVPAFRGIVCSIHALILVPLVLCQFPRMLYLMRRLAGKLYRTTASWCSIPNNGVAKRASRYQSTQ